jgi:hypothetical protein
MRRQERSLSVQLDFTLTERPFPGTSSSRREHSGSIRSDRIVLEDGDVRCARRPGLGSESWDGDSRTDGTPNVGRGRRIAHFPGESRALAVSTMVRVGVLYRPALLRRRCESSKVVVLSLSMRIVRRRVIGKVAGIALVVRWTVVVALRCIVCRILAERTTVRRLTVCVVIPMLSIFIISRSIHVPHQFARTLGSPQTRSILLLARLILIHRLLRRVVESGMVLLVAVIGIRDIQA